MALNYTPLIITISINQEYIQTKKHIIVKDSKEEKIFVKELIEAIKDIDTCDLSDVNYLKNVVLSFASSMERI